MASVVVRLASNPPQTMEAAAVARTRRDGLAGKPALCMSVLVEARRQLAARRFGPLFCQLLARAGDLLDEMDEVLVGLDPAGEHDAFVRVRALHRDLEEIQSLVPPKYRSLARGSWLG